MDSVLASHRLMNTCLSGALVVTCGIFMYLNNRLSTQMSQSGNFEERYRIVNAAFLELEKLYEEAERENETAQKEYEEKSRAKERELKATRHKLKDAKNEHKQLSRILREVKQRTGEKLIAEAMASVVGDEDLMTRENILKTLEQRTCALNLGPGC